MAGRNAPAGRRKKSEGKGLKRLWAFFAALAVCALFASRPQECLTVEEAYQALFKAGSDVSKTTVYRAISRLCQTGRLRRYAPHESGEAARYQHSPCTQSHLHIRCVDCGALAHLHCDEAEAFARHLGQHHGFTLDESQTVLYGLCEACRKKHAKGGAL